jgi:coenzyme F420-reducing hydrogenase beta subunit
MTNNITRYKKHCCGCGVCSAVCPKTAITMKENYQGFKYPSVDNKKCINCGLCIDNCSFNNSQSSNNLNEFPQFFALKHKNQDVRVESRSGGAYTALSDVILNKHGVVYGCELMNCKSALHVRASTQAERNRQRGSKYIQSDMEDVLYRIKEDLVADKYVLFSGTPCQVAAVKAFLKRINTDKLILVDVLCHGVGSPRFWKDNLESIEHKLNSEIIEAVFRNKKDFGWESHVETVYFDEQKI